MHRKAAFALATVVIVSLGGCSWFGSNDEPQALDFSPPEVIPEPSVPVESVRNIELGRTRDGLAITAYGYAPGRGYSLPELRPRRNGKPGTDGYLDFDFFARQPAPNLALGPGDLPERLVRADALLSPRDLRGVRGIRIHGVTGGLQLAF